MPKKLKILLSNDDGIYAPGIRALYKELKKLGQVWVVAPLEERSTTGHSLTIHKPLRLVKIDKDFYGVSGSPADCVYIGMHEIMDGPPDLVVSGINRGANLGQDVYYSGTVSAAREACILGIPAIAVSLAVQFKSIKSEEDLHFGDAAKLTLKVIRSLSKITLPHHTLLNLNIPDLPMKKVKGVRLAAQGFRFYSGSLLRRKDHRGRDYYWVGGLYKGFEKDENADCYLVDKGYAALTPIKLDSTDMDCLNNLQDQLKLGVLARP